MADRVVRFAFVRYLKDNEKDIVPITYFKNFSPTDCDDFQAAKPYLVQWRGDLAGSSDDEDVHYKAQILMLGASREELQKKKDASRVRFPKILDTSVEESSSSEDEQVILQKETAKSRKDRRRDQDLAKKKSLRAIISENLAKKKSSPLFTAGTPGDQPSISTCSQKSARACEHQECLSQLKRERKRCREAEAKNLELELEIKRLKKTSEEYQNLNKDLQLELLHTLKGKKQERSSSGKPKSQPQPLPAHNEEPIQLSDDPYTSSGPTYVTNDGMVSIGAGISLTEEQWEALQCQTKHSLFVKGLAVATWGTEVLKDRSVEGKICPRFKDERQARAPLSPQKLKVMKECFMDRLTKLNASKEEQALEAAKFKKYITEKIQDINRVMRKQAKCD